MKYVLTAAVALAIGVFGTLFWPAAAGPSLAHAASATCITGVSTTCTVPISVFQASTSSPCTYVLDFELPLATGVTKATIVWNIVGDKKYQFAKGGNAVTILNDVGDFANPTQLPPPQSFQYTFDLHGTAKSHDYNLSIVDTVANAACAVQSQPPQPYPRIKNE